MNKYLAAFLILFCSELFAIEQQWQLVDLRAAWRQDDILYWEIIRYQNLNNAVYEKSSLVADNDYYFVGVGITWILAASH